MIALLARILLACALFANPAFAQNYPDRPVKIIVPFPPGGDVDPITRSLGEQLQQAWGQAVVVENKPGVNGVVGTDFAVKSAPDGYTLLLCSLGQLAINPYLYPKLPYNVEREIEPISLLAITPMVLVVNHTVMAKTLSEFLAYARSNPGKLSYASAGNGNITHLVAVYFSTSTGVQMVHVPYKGGGPAITDLLGGHVNLYFNPLPSALGYLKQGRATPLAVTSLKRSPHLPDVPTLHELGLRDFDAKVWYGLCAPKGTPMSIVQKVNAETVRAASGGAFRDRLIALGTVPSPTTTREFAALIREESARWSKAIRENNITID